MISFGSIKMGSVSGKDKNLKPGEINVEDYISQLKKNNASVANKDAIISNITEELNNIAGTINRAISLIESDQRIQYCINGRDLTQINGISNRNNRNTTEARFPNLLNQYRVTIAMSALRKAQDNYNKKLEEAITKATKDASADVAHYMCLMLPSGNSIGGNTQLETPLTAPYSISYEVGSGISNKVLASMNGTSTTKYDNASMKSGASSAAGEIIGTITSGIATTAFGLPFSSKPVSVNIPGGTKTVRATFNAEKRICHLCTEFVTRECKQTGMSFWMIDSRKLKCGAEKREETCDDIEM